MRISKFILAGVIAFSASFCVHAADTAAQAAARAALLQKMNELDGGQPSQTQTSAPPVVVIPQETPQPTPPPAVEPAVTPPPAAVAPETNPSTVTETPPPAATAPETNPPAMTETPAPAVTVPETNPPAMPQTEPMPPVPAPATETAPPTVAMTNEVAPPPVEETTSPMPTNPPAPAVVEEPTNPPAPPAVETAPPSTTAQQPDQMTNVPSPAPGEVVPLPPSGPTPSAAALTNGVDSQAARAAQPMNQTPQMAAPAPNNSTSATPTITPIEAPPLPITAAKQARLQALLEQYKADQITPAQYQAERQKILSEP
jgi:hypothetical protein